ncbi:hypothetical protein GQR58_005829 [Nymphon striatum]|nr:hypothetical protein GQR58_005829 [Nymphon striatum]
MSPTRQDYHKQPKFSHLLLVRRSGRQYMEVSNRFACRGGVTVTSLPSQSITRASNMRAVDTLKLEEKSNIKLLLHKKKNTLLCGEFKSAACHSKIYSTLQNCYKKKRRQCLTFLEFGLLSKALISVFIWSKSVTVEWQGLFLGGFVIYEG